MHTNGSVSSYSNPQMDRLLDGAREQTDPARREGMYHSIVDMQLDECPLIYHCNANYNQVFDRRLTGYTPSNQEYIQFMDEIAWS
jgi:peptide/nickel transport system substrate-binding protein